MKTILQLSTGVYRECTDLGTEEIRKRLENILKQFPVNTVIFGWGRRKGLFQEIIHSARKYGVKTCLWMPVFADVRDPEHADPMVFPDVGVNQSADTRPGDAFHFVCPGSARNRKEAMAAYESLAAECAPDAVFLDRIRYPSAARSSAHLLGCVCENCRKRLNESGADMDRLYRAIRTSGNFDCLCPAEMENGRYHYRDPDTECLAGLKRQTIYQAIAEYTAFFHSKGIQVGIDVFAPALADLVGQDLSSLLPVVDFVKPMMYFRTCAPAGIPWELESLGGNTVARLSEIWNAPVGEISSMEKQLLSQREYANKIFPGIEINRIPGICEPDEAGFREAVRAAGAAGCDAIVLSWNVLQARDDDLMQFKKALDGCIPNIP